MIGELGDCGHLVDHLGTSRLCLRCQRGKDLLESDILAGFRSGAIPDPRIGVVPDNCPACDGYLNAAHDVDGGDRPKPDDRTICIHCGAFMKYLSDLRLALLTAEETAETKQQLSPAERAAVAALAQRRAGKGGRA